MAKTFAVWGRNVILTIYFKQQSLCGRSFVLINDPMLSKQPSLPPKTSGNVTKYIRQGSHP